LNREKKISEFLDSVYGDIEASQNREIRTIETIDREIARLHKLIEMRPQSASNKKRFWKQIDNLLEKRKKMVDEKPVKKPRRVSKKKDTETSQK